MSGEHASDLASGASRSILPPVFTRWSPQDPPAHTPAEPRRAPVPPAGSTGAGVGVPSFDEPYATSDFATDPLESTEDFPLDAFYIPEGSELTASPAGAATFPEPTGTMDESARRIAERLENAARLLRVDGRAAVHTLAMGDRVDSMIAGLLAGILATDDA